MAALVEHGMLLQSARGPMPNVAELVAGEPIKGSWWGHPKGHAIFDALGALDDSPDVVRLRLVNGKVTLVHRRLWPALVRAADRFTPEAIGRTARGAHARRARTVSTSNPSPNGSPATVHRRCRATSTLDRSRSPQLPSRVCRLRLDCSGRGGVALGIGRQHGSSAARPPARTPAGARPSTVRHLATVERPTPLNLHCSPSPIRLPLRRLDVSVGAWIGAARGHRRDAGDRPLPPSRSARADAEGSCHRVDHLGDVRAGVLRRDRCHVSAAPRSASTSAAT